MKKIFLTLFGLIMLIGILQAQNYTISIMKSGSAIGKYKLADIDSIIFYKPAGYTGTTVTDIEGNVYKTVTIGTQVWMAENLKTTKYKDGTDILLVTGADAWNNLTTPAYCWYTNDSVTYANPYGALYNWYSVETGNLCPTGWHIPSNAEWTELTDYLGGASVAGGKLKEIGTTHWNSPNTGATNISGFTALPCGFRNYNGYYSYIGFEGLWVSYDDKVESGVKVRCIDSGSDAVTYSDIGKSAVSIRCIRD